MASTHGCGNLTCQYCYDDITEFEVEHLTEQRRRREASRAQPQAPTAPKPPPPRPAPPRPEPLPHAALPMTVHDLVGNHRVYHE